MREVILFLLLINKFYVTRVILWIKQADFGNIVFFWYTKENKMRYKYGRCKNGEAVF